MVVLTAVTEAYGSDTIDPWQLLDPAYLPRLRHSRCVQYTRRHQSPVEIEWHGKKVETYEVTIDGPGIITRMWCTEAGGGLYYLQINDPRGELRYALEGVESESHEDSVAELTQRPQKRRGYDGRTSQELLTAFRCSSGRGWSVDRWFRRRRVRIR